MLRLLRWFGRWFASPLGICQTVLALGLWIAGEKLHVVRDPSGYQILYWLTVYSAVTQPVLAYIASESGKHQEVTLRHIESIVEHFGIGRVARQEDGSEAETGES